MEKIKELFIKLKNKFIKFCKWVWEECKDWHTVVIFAIVVVVMYSPVWGGYLCHALFHWKWCSVMATAYLAFWAGPFTPFFPMCIAITLGIRRIIDRIKGKDKANRNSDEQNMQESFNAKLKEFSMNDNHIESAIIVGSYARGTNTENSDLDICLITTNKNEMVENPDFVKKFGAFSKMQTEYYGECTSIRVWYENGLEAEFGIVEPSWIRLPLDKGTRKVLNDGYKVIVDKKNYFQNLEL